MKIDFEVIEPKSGYNSYPPLVIQPWGRNINSNISLDKEKREVKGKGKNGIIPLYPRESRLQDEPDDEDENVGSLYKIVKKERDIVNPNSKGEIYLALSKFVG